MQIKTKKYFVGCENLRTFATVFEKGRLAERLGTGLQNLLLRFKSGSDLDTRTEPLNLEGLCSRICVYLVQKSQEDVLRTIWSKAVTTEIRQRRRVTVPQKVWKPAGI